MRGARSCVVPSPPVLELRQTEEEHAGHRDHEHDSADPGRGQTPAQSGSARATYTVLDEVSPV